MSEEEKSSSIRYVKFTGKGKDFHEWKVKTLALARRKGFDMYLRNDLEDTEDSKKATAFVKGNADAWDQLVLSLSGTPFDLILEADENAHKAWKLLLNKYEVSDEKQESLTDVTKEWNSAKLESVRVDPDDWFSTLFRINKKFGKIKKEYEKDEDTMKAHVLVDLPDEYKPVRTNLCMNSAYSYADYKKHIRHFWYTELGGKEMIEKGTCAAANIKSDTGSSQNTAAFYTNSTGGFRFTCRKCGLPGIHGKMFTFMQIRVDVPTYGAVHIFGTLKS